MVIIVVEYDVWFRTYYFIEFITQIYDFTLVVVLFVRFHDFIIAASSENNFVTIICVFNGSNPKNDLYFGQAARC